MHEIKNVGVEEGIIDQQPPATDRATLYDVLNVDINKVVLRVRGRVTPVDAAKRLLALVETARSKFSGECSIDLHDVANYRFMIIERNGDVIEYGGVDIGNGQVTSVNESLKVAILDRGIEFLAKFIEIKSTEVEQILLGGGRAISCPAVIEKYFEAEEIELLRDESELPQLKMFKPKGMNIPGNNRSIHNKVKPGKFFNKNRNFRSSGRGR
ncbi:hypothetical protein TOTORO_00720 [Serratia phage vB_SmaS-Totoro]|nr:hypothetical protein TOTORO_00720 [Serratia phage vB_SmaS-Totoro]